MFKLNKVLPLAILIFLFSSSTSFAQWRVGVSGGAGEYRIKNSNEDDKKHKGDVYSLGANLTLPFGLYSRLDRVIFDDDHLKGNADLVSLGWYHSVGEPYHISWALGYGKARNKLKDGDFKYDQDEFVQLVISAGYRISKNLDITIGQQSVSGLSSAKNADGKDVDYYAALFLLGLVYNFE